MEDDFKTDEFMLDEDEDLDEAELEEEEEEVDPLDPNGLEEEE